MVSVFVVINFWNLWNSWLLYFGRLLWLAKRNAVEVFLRWKNDFVFIFTYFLMLLVGKLVPQHSVSDNVEKCVVKIHVSGGRKLKIDGAKKTRLLAENLVKLGFYAKSRKMAFNFYLLPNSTLFFFSLRSLTVLCKFKRLLCSRWRLLMFFKSLCRYLIYDSVGKCDKMKESICKVME